MAHISPFLMFKDQAEEAVQFYLKVFPDSEIVSTTRFLPEEIAELERLPADERPGPAGKLKHATMKLNGMTINLGNGGKFFDFSHGTSLYVRCKTQEEIDQIWDLLAGEGGEIEECGWVTDKYGVSWQVAPEILDQWMQDSDRSKVTRVSLQILRSKKLVIEELRRAFEDEPVKAAAGA